jgi:large subunit ribosomal protein L29
MALLRTKEIRSLNDKARVDKLKELRNELLHERGVAAMGGAPHSPGKIRAIRRNIARMLTIMREEEIAKARAPAPKETTKPEEGA